MLKGFSCGKWKTKSGGAEEGLLDPNSQSRVHHQQRERTLDLVKKLRKRPELETKDWGELKSIEKKPRERAHLTKKKRMKLMKTETE